MDISIQKMTDALSKRGPDREGFFHSGPMQMGHRRLSIIDLSDKANQPMNDGNYTLVFNGTIYNYIQLRNELINKSYTFQSTGDTEVILKAYQEWGESCVDHFNGIFAFAIWDSQTQKLFLARDKFGIKPLYYSENQKKFRFSSTVQSLLASRGPDREIDTNIDHEALHFHFHLHTVVPAPRTILKGIRKLGPAQTMTIDRTGKKEIKTYWHLHAKRPHRDREEIIFTETVWINKVRESIWQAVDLQRKASDVPIGILLSGGLDSSLLVGILAELGGTKIETFSIGFEEFAGVKADEFEFSDMIATKFKTQHHRYLAPYSEMFTKLPDATQCMSEPMVSTDVTAFYLLAERVSQQVKVVMSGQGADEVLGGYFWYPRMATETGTYLDRFAKHYLDRSHSEYLAMIDTDLSYDPTRSYIANELSSQYAETFMDAVFRLDVTQLIVDDPVKRVDNMSMAWGLEARVPFLDEKFVELCMQIPPELKLRSDGKYPLKAVARRLIPDAVIDRPKGYFPVPVLRYVQGPYFSFMSDILNSDKCRNRKLFNREYIDKLMANPQSDFTPIQGNKLWHLALLELWLQQNGL
jgi:asparagine synthase (glutamine-hydrolysing)